MGDDGALDALFRTAVAAIDAGDVAALDAALSAHPRLVRERLEAPGAWLADRAALAGFFARPYLLWFVAEDPVRNGTLPANVGDVARAIVRAATRQGVESLQEQLDSALRLVAWSTVARDCGVQIELVDVLLDAGASPDGDHVYDGRYGTHSDSAIYNRNLAAAAHLVRRGARLTLTTAVGLERWGDAERLAETATSAEKEDAFVQAALHGSADALRRMLAWGLDPTTVSRRNQSHGTALHHAVWSGSLDAVRVLVEAGADPRRRDTLYDGTPLDWAFHAEHEAADDERRERYRAIAALLRAREAAETRVIQGDDMDEKALFTKFWTDETKTTLRVLERIPEGSDYRPDPKSRTAQEIAWQIVCEERMIVEAMETGKAEWAPEEMPATMKDVVAAYARQSETLPRRWRDLPAERWNGTLELFGAERPASPLAWGFLFDIVHHRGQITTYLRPMGSTVPQVYGPSADEP